MTYIKKFVGTCPGGENKRFTGNSILMQISPRTYMFIGWNIYRFTLRSDTIKRYVSCVGNNDVPYPFAIGEKNAYLMIETITMPLSEVKNKKDPYDDLYSMYGETFNRYKEEHRLKHKVVHNQL